MTRLRLFLWLLIAVGLGDFVFRGVVPSYAYDRNDFSDPYCASWLWRHGQNPYDVALATGINQTVVHSKDKIVPVYPPTAYLLISPMTILPWKAANLLWALCSLAAIALMAYVLPRVAGLSFRQDKAWIIAACVFCSGPLHTSLHAANSATIAISLCFLAVYWEMQNRETWAAAAVAVATCLKPQLGLWPFVFYAFRGHWRIVLPATAFGACIGAATILRMPVSPSALLQDYRSNLHYWFDPGRLNDFSVANRFRFELLNTQVLLQPLVHSSHFATLIAAALFGAGLAVWFWAAKRDRNCDELLALSCLMALGLIPVYHRSYDAAVALLPLAWITQKWNRDSKPILAALGIAVVLAPAQSVFVRAMARSSPATLHGWAWNSLACGYGSAATILLVCTLIYAFASRSQFHYCQDSVQYIKSKTTDFSQEMGVLHET